MIGRIFRLLLSAIESVLARHQSEAVFPAGTFEIEQVILEHHDKIATEFFAYTTRHAMIPIQYISKEQRDLTGDLESWKSLFLIAFKHVNHNISKAFESTLSVLGNRPEVNTVFFSRLEPGASLPPHQGKYNGLLRLQLGIMIKNPILSYVTVGQENVNLEEGEIVVFDDTFEHSAENRSEFPRIVLIVDFLRPLPFFLHVLNLCGLAIIRNSSYVKESLKNLNKY